MLALQVFATTHTRQSFSLASFSSERSLSPVQEHIVRDPTLRRPVTHKRLRQTRTQEPPHTCTQWTQKHSLPRSLSQQHIVCGLFLQGNTQLCDCNGCCGLCLSKTSMKTHQILVFHRGWHRRSACEVAGPSQLAPVILLRVLSRDAARRHARHRARGPSSHGHDRFGEACGPSALRGTRWRAGHPGCFADALSATFLLTPAVNGFRGGLERRPARYARCLGLGGVRTACRCRRHPAACITTSSIRFSAYRVDHRSVRTSTPACAFAHAHICVPVPRRTRPRNADLPVQESCPCAAGSESRLPIPESCPSRAGFISRTQTSLERSLREGLSPIQVQSGCYYGLGILIAI